MNETTATKPRILIVAAERVISETWTMILNQSGFEARAAYSGEKAVEMAAGFNPDVLVSDVIMHDLNGIDAAIQIGKVLPSMRILLFSGWSGVGYLMEQAYNRGYDLEIFGIPIHPRDLMNKLREAVNPENLWSNARLRVPPSFLEPPKYTYTFPRSRLRRISDKLFQFLKISR